MRIGTARLIYRYPDVSPWCSLLDKREKRVQQERVEVICIDLESLETRGG